MYFAGAVLQATHLNRQDSCVVSHRLDEFSSTPMPVLQPHSVPKGFTMPLSALDRPSWASALASIGTKHEVSWNALDASKNLLSSAASSC
jgi:hypothetical protein